MLKLCINNLKSNMDRFIVEKLYFRLSDSGNLKSNMDRFIGSKAPPHILPHQQFKIQYG